MGRGGGVLPQVQDVQWGLADMSAGGYETAERLEMTAFSSPYDVCFACTYLTLPFLTLLYLTLPDLTLHYLTLPDLTLPDLT